MVTPLAPKQRREGGSDLLDDGGLAAPVRSEEGHDEAGGVGDAAGDARDLERAGARHARPPGEEHAPQVRLPGVDGVPPAAPRRVRQERGFPRRPIARDALARPPGILAPLPAEAGRVGVGEARLRDPLEERVDERVGRSGDVEAASGAREPGRPLAGVEQPVGRE